MPASPRSPRLSAIAGLVLIVLAVAIVVATVIHAAARTRQPTTADLTVTHTPVSAPIPSGFLGISTETRTLEQYTGTNPKAINPVFVKLLEDLGHGQHPLLRIAGDSTDATWYPAKGVRKPPGITFAINQRWLQIARATAQAIDGKLLIGVNVEGNDRAVAVAEADAMVHTIGRQYIDAIEVGNEPELYSVFPLYHDKAGKGVLGRSKTYTEQDFFAQFRSWAAAMPAGVPIAGPAFGIGKWMVHLRAFLKSQPRLSLVTIHAYPLVDCGSHDKVKIAQVLAPSADQGYIAQVAPLVRYAHDFGKPMRIDEINAISCGGTYHVSDSFSTALWMINDLFGLAQTGVGGVNVHMTPGAINSILDPVGRHGSDAISTQPAWYAMMMFAQAAPPGSRMLRVAGTADPQDQTWATVDSAGTIHVVLSDKSASHGETLTIAVPGARGAATVESLRAPSLKTTERVTLGGQTFGAATTTGVLSGPAQHQTIVARDGHYTVHVPPASVEMLTLQ